MRTNQCAQVVCNDLLKAKSLNVMRDCRTLKQRRPEHTASPLAPICQHDGFSMCSISRISRWWRICSYRKPLLHWAIFNLLTFKSLHCFCRVGEKKRAIDVRNESDSILHIIILVLFVFHEVIS